MWRTRVYDQDTACKQQRPSHVVWIYVRTHLWPHFFFLMIQHIKGSEFVAVVRCLVSQTSCGRSSASDMYSIGSGSASWICLANVKEKASSQHLVRRGSVVGGIFITKVHTIERIVCNRGEVSSGALSEDSVFGQQSPPNRKFPFHGFLKPLTPAVHYRSSVPSAVCLPEGLCMSS